MKFFTDYPPITAAIVAGLFALLCKWLELRKGGPLDLNSHPQRGLVGWLVIISAAAAIILSLYSLNADRVRVSTVNWDEEKCCGSITIDETLICYGYVETAGIDPTHREFAVEFPSGFEHVPTITDSILPEGATDRGWLFGVAKRKITTHGFVMNVWGGVGPVAPNESVRYNWTAIGMKKR